MAKDLKKIAVLVAYFGEFPEWADLYFETLKRNAGIDFIFYTDVKADQYAARNIHIKNITYPAYISKVSKALGVKFAPASPYKLCDIRPFHGIIHEEDFLGYDFWGYTDMDILFGDIRSFYTKEILNRFDVISSHEIRISGHFALYKNNLVNNKKCFQIYQWKKFVEKPEFVGIDEHGITNAFLLTWVDRLNEKFKLKIDNPLVRYLRKKKRESVYLVEQFTTPFTVIRWLDGSINSEQPETWYYKDGKITNQRDGDRNFIYLHMMNFRSSQWRHDQTKAPWEGMEKICFADVGHLKTGIRIDPTGIHPL